VLLTVFFTFPIAAGGALRSLSEMGAMLTMFTTTIKPGSMPRATTSSSSGAAGSTSVTGNGREASGSPAASKVLGSVKKEDTLVMDTKLKIIDILQFILDVRLDYRISCLLSIFKREFDESERSERCVSSVLSAFCNSHLV
jgi:hypothetical protein